MTDLVPYQDKVLSSYDDVEKAARAMAGSGFFQDTRQASQAIVKIMAGRELGFGPFASMTGVNIIQGKPAFGANIMAACVKKSGRYNYRVTEMTDKVCTIEFMEKMDGKWLTSGVSSFTIEDAKKAGTKNLEKFPRNMLFARAMSNGVRWFCPDVMNGSVAYTPEELGAETDQDGNVVEVVEVTRDAPIAEPIPAEVSEVVDEVVPGEFVEEKPKMNGNKWARPMPPEVLKEALRLKVAKAKPASEKQTNLVRMLLLEYFADRDDERHQAQEFLTGHRSFKDIEPEMISAILDWMKPVQSNDGSGAYVLEKNAKIELTMVSRRFMENLGQETLDL